MWVKVKIMEKKLFIEMLGNFISEFNKITGKGTFDQVKKLEYVKEGGEEFIYALFEEGMQKRVNITADSEESVLSDFANNIRSATWLSKSDCRYRKFN